MTARPGPLLLPVVVGLLLAAAPATPANASRVGCGRESAARVDCSASRVPGGRSVTSRAPTGCGRPFDFFATSDDERSDGLADRETARPRFTLRDRRAHMRVAVRVTAHRVRFTNRSRYAVDVSFAYRCGVSGS